jgi:hypothetical protein
LLDLFDWSVFAREVYDHIARSGVVDIKKQDVQEEQ